VTGANRADVTAATKEALGRLSTVSDLILVVAPVIYSLLVGLYGRLTGGRGQAATMVTPDVAAQPASLTAERVALSTEG